MTNEELSKKVAELYGIDTTRVLSNGDFSCTWLHDDSARVFELMVEHELDMKSYPYFKYVDVGFGDNFDQEYFKDHNNDKALATRIAILKCLVKMKE